ncbi:MAG: cytochrome c3 family protein [Ignavibacteriales bacterium]
MAQIFPPGANTLAKLTILAAVFMIALITLILFVIYRSSYVTQAQVIREQPLPFSHKHHVSGLGIDCRYCHTSVEESSFAGMPPTETCMTCHSQIWSNSPMLEPVRQSLGTNTPIRWTRVYNLPDYVYFDHSIHVYKGIGCSTCHGRVDQMPLMWEEQPLQMGWCLGCHREPERFVRPRDQVFNMEWRPPKDQLALGQRLIKEYKIQKRTDCVTCHR